MSVLVVGGAGYIGSHTVRRLLEAGEDVVIVDALYTGHKEAVPENCRLYEFDIRDEAALDELFKNEEIDTVIHFGAFSIVGESMKDPLKYYDNNLGGTLSLLKVMTRHRIPRIVFSSTAATYGEPEQIPIHENDKTSPTNPYGETKLAMEKMFHWSNLAGGPNYVALRYFNACGADESAEIGEDHNPETHLIPLILQVPLGTRDKISIFGTDYQTPDGTCIRDYIHVDDLANAHILAMNYLRDGGKSDVFNLGNGTGFSVRQVIDAAEEVVGTAIPREEKERREGDPAKLVASSNKAKEVLGWTPEKTDLPTIISSAWKWHRSHPEGFR